jgi:phosphoribosylformylglycinamidine synthase
MTLAVDPRKLISFLELAKKMDVEATALGKFTASGKFHVCYGRKTVASLDMSFLHEGVPQLQLKAKWKAPQNNEPRFSGHLNYNKALQQMLARLNICSKESVVRQYDHEVQAGSVVKPLTGVANDGPSDAAIIRPLLDSLEGVVVAHGICPRYSDIDTYDMTACAIDEAVRNAICVGADIDHLAGLDNFCWCDPVRSDKNPDGEYKLAQLVRSNRAIYDYTTAYGIPCISGKDSMKNDYQIGRTKISIPPTILYSVIGKIADVNKAVTMDAKCAHDLVYIVGETKEELGGSEWFAMHKAIGNVAPKVNAPSALKIYRALQKAIENELIASCHDCSDGGLAVALIETAFAGGLGMHVDLNRVPYTGTKRNDYILFSESASRFIVTIHPHAKAGFEKIMKSISHSLIGEVTNGGLFSIRGLNDNILIKEKITKFKEVWQKPLNF